MIIIWDVLLSECEQGNLAKFSGHESLISNITENNIRKFLIHPPIKVTIIFKFVYL